MPYVDRAALQERFGADEISQRESALAVGGLDTIIRDAESMIDGYLAARYALPLAVVPDQLAAVAADLVRYKLLGDAVSEQARNAYRDAVAWLRDVAAGKVIVAAVAPVPGNSPATVVIAEPGQRLFSRENRL